MIAILFILVALLHELLNFVFLSTFYAYKAVVCSNYFGCNSEMLL